MNYAVLDNNTFLSKRIHAEESETGYIRTPYQRDRDRILHSRALGVLCIKHRFLMLILEITIVTDLHTHWK